VGLALRVAVGSRWDVNIQASAIDQGILKIIVGKFSS